MNVMSSEANAVGGKTARACDSCIRKRARWYCAADDAFLCQSCDSSVHSANPLARRHQRLRLKTASYKSAQQPPSPTWHIKKPRTPRHGNGKHSRNPFFHLVPQLLSEDANSHDDNDLLYRVPIFDPQLCATISSPSSVTSTDHQGPAVAVAVATPSQLQQNLHGILPSDAELAEFAADVETLLGRGLENECVGMEDLGLVDTIEEDCSVAGENVKMEDQLERDKSFQFISFDFDLGEVKDIHEIQRNNISLQLDYEAVILAWATHKSPWTTGHKPNMDPDQCWHQCMGTAFHYPYGGFGIHPVMFDGGREARVSRYREKRRTRLFSKKIRYEVRKLNAEKRPRMKGRFVKRASFPPPTFPNLK